MAYSQAPCAQLGEDDPAGSGDEHKDEEDDEEGPEGADRHLQT